jgi:hypothetical protein
MAAAITPDVAFLVGTIFGLMAAGLLAMALAPRR